MAHVLVIYTYVVDARVAGVVVVVSMFVVVCVCVTLSIGSRDILDTNIFIRPTFIVHNTTRSVHIVNKGRECYLYDLVDITRFIPYFMGCGRTYQPPFYHLYLKSNKTMDNRSYEEGVIERTDLITNILLDFEPESFVYPTQDFSRAINCFISCSIHAIGRMKEKQTRIRVHAIIVEIHEQCILHYPEQYTQSLRDGVVEFFELLGNTYYKP